MFIGTFRTFHMCLMLQYVTVCLYFCTSRRKIDNKNDNEIGNGPALLPAILTLCALPQQPCVSPSKIAPLFPPFLLYINLSPPTSNTFHTSLSSPPHTLGFSLKPVESILSHFYSRRLIPCSRTITPARGEAKAYRTYIQ